MTIVGLGEILVRFDPGPHRMHEGPALTMHVGGGEYNALHTLSHTFKQPVAMVTQLVQDPLGKFVEQEMNRYKVDTKHIQWTKPDPLGKVHNAINFRESGTSIRRMYTTYYRYHTPANQINPEDLDWKDILKDATWFHSGSIFTGISSNTQKAQMDAIWQAKEQNIPVSYDLNFRKAQWEQRGALDTATKSLQEIVHKTDVLMGSVYDMATLLVHKPVRIHDIEDLKSARAIIEEVAKKYDVHTVAASVKTGEYVNNLNYSAILVHDQDITQAKPRRQLPIFDSVGMGDAFSGSIIYSCLQNEDYNTMINRATATAAMTATTPGDVCKVSMLEIDDEMVRLRDDKPPMDKK